MRNVIGCRLLAILAIGLLPGLVLGQKAPAPSTQNVSVVNTPNVNVSNTPSVNVPSGVTVNNSDIDPVHVTGSVTVSNLPAAIWPVEVANTPSVNVTNQPTVHVAGTVPVTGSVALIGTPNVTVTNTASSPVPVSGAVTVTASSALPVTLASAATKRYSIAFTCYARSECGVALTASIPSGKVFVVDFVSGIMVTAGTTSAGYVLVLTHADVATFPDTLVGCLALPSKTQELGPTTYAFFSAATSCNLRGSLSFFADNTEYTGANSASILLSGYLTDQ